MWASALEIAAAEIVRLTPNTPPALWMPYVAYAATMIAALIIAAAVLKTTGSRLAAAAAAIGYVVTPSTVENGFGPLLFALMLFGVFFAPRSRPHWVTLVLLIAGLFVTTGAIRVLAWIFAGYGLAMVADYAAARRPTVPRLRVAVVAVLTVIVVTARLPAAATSTPPAPKPMGHDRMTLSKMRALVSNIPSGSDIVRDDALTGILLRAMSRDFARARVNITTIDLDPSAIRPELSTGRRMFALPHAQQSLSMQGFKIVDSLRVADRGLAEVTTAGDCVTASETWQTATSLTGLGNLAFAADRESRRGPVVIYLLGNEPIHVSAPNWPARTLRGFSPRTFDLTNAQDRQDLERQRTEDDGPWPLDLSGRQSVTRVALWRMPDSALAMPIALSAPAVYAAVKLAPEADRAVSVCPAFPVTASAIR